MGKHRDNHHKKSSDEDNSDFSSPQLLEKLIKKQSLIPQPINLSPPKINLKPIEDRRRWHPDGKQVAPQATQRLHRALKIASPAPTAPKYKLPSRVAFSAPKHVVVCVRRKTRKEVLFAKKLTKRGSGSRKHRNPWSEISCRS